MMNNEKVYTEKEANTVKNLFSNSIIYKSKEDIKNITEKTIFSNENFKSDLDKTIEELESEYSKEVIEKVVKHYIFSVINFMHKVHDYQIRILIVGAFSITVPNNVFRKTSKYYYRNHFPLLRKLNAIFNKRKSKLILKTKNYVQSESKQSGV